MRLYVGPDFEPGDRISRRNPVSSFLVIGYGNPLRGDDALGPLAAEKLTERCAGVPGVTVMTAHQLTLDLAETFAAYGRVILIDARAAEPVGELYVQKVHPSEKLPQAFSHYLDPAELLAVCQILYRASPEIILTGINAVNFTVGAPLSEPVAARIPELLDQVMALLA